MGILQRFKAKLNYGLGVCYEIGKYMEQDINEAIKYYNLAVEQGNTNAMCNLGVAT